MEKRWKIIIRRSIHTFLQNYQYFTTTPVLLLLPFPASVLLLQALFSSSSPLLMPIRSRFNPLLYAAGLFQSMFLAVFSFPFTLSSLIAAKASIIQALRYRGSNPQTPPFSFMSLYKSLLLTHLCNSVLFTTSTIAASSLLFLAFSTHGAVLGFSLDNPLLMLAVRAAYYSLLTNTVAICNLALAVAGMEDTTCFSAIIKACLVWRGRNSTALLLALIANLSLTAMQALFNFRVIGPYHLFGYLQLSVALEGLLIAYLYSLLIVLDTIASCLLFNSWKSTCRSDQISRCYNPAEPVEAGSSTYRD